MAQESEKTLLYRERKAFEGGITLIKPNYKFENTTDTLQNINFNKTKYYLVHNI